MGGQELDPWPAGLLGGHSKPTQVMKHYLENHSYNIRRTSGLSLSFVASQSQGRSATYQLPHIRQSTRIREEHTWPNYLLKQSDSSSACMAGDSPPEIAARLELNPTVVSDITTRKTCLNVVDDPSIPPLANIVIPVETPELSTKGNQNDLTTCVTARDRQLWTEGRAFSLSSA